MFHQACANAPPGPSRIRRELAEKQAGNRIGRLPGADRPRQDRRDHGRRRETMVSDDTPGLMHDKNCREALFLIGKGSRLQPVIERRLAAGEGDDIMRGRQRFGSR